MAHCTYTYQGKTYEAHEFDDVLRAMSPVDASKFMPTVKSVPDAPLIGRTDAWVSLAVKKIIHIASTNGYDKVAFVNGAQSADRYDLSKQISKIEYEPTDDGKFELVAFGLNKEKVLEEDEIDLARVEELVGKEIAKKIEAGEGEKSSSAGGYRNWHILSGLDLKVGGEGMQAFYNQIVPNIVKPLVKKLGSQMESVRILIAGDKVGIDGMRTGAKRVDQLGFTITDAMRDAAAQGMPLFKLKKRSVSGDVPQSINSAATSRRQVPAAMNQIDWIPGTTNLDIGAGKFSDATEFLSGLDVSNLEFDPFNRSEEENFSALQTVIGESLADTATILNVLNVIKEKTARDNVIRRAAKAIKPDGTAYFQTYEGDKSGKGAPSRDGWQENRATSTYLDEISKHFGTVVRKGQVIEATDPIKKDGDTWEAPDGSIAFSRAKQTLTDAFKKWFADSKVVDADGNPLVVYHGTTRDFSEFKKTKSIRTNFNTAQKHLGHFFTDDAKYADQYTSFWSDGESFKDGANTMPIYLSIKNPKYEPISKINEIEDRWTMQQAAQYKKSLIAQGYDGIVFSGETPAQGELREFVAFNPTQIKSAIGNNGDYSLENNDIAFSRGPVAMARDSIESARKLNLIAGYQLGDLLKSSGKVGWWSRTVGTQFNLAQKNSEFRKVYDGVQHFISDVSTFATRAADLAPTMLPKLEKLVDLKKRALKSKDVEAVSKPIFEGTLNWTRNAAGLPVQTDDVSTAGIRWEPEELKAQFGLNDMQVGLYKQFRNATDQSIKSLGMSEIVKYLGEDITPKMKNDAMDDLDAGRTAIEKMLSDEADAAGAAWMKVQADKRKETKAFAKAETARIDAIKGPMEKANAQDKYMDALIKLEEKWEIQEDNAKAIRDFAVQKQKAVDSMFEQSDNLIARGYAPLSRFGETSVYVEDKDGEQLYFGLYESEREANRAERALREEFPDAMIRTGKMSQEAHKLFHGVTPETLSLFGNAVGVEGDALFQQYLKLATASRSSMKRLIKRKGIEGYSNDATRVLAGFITSNARRTSSNLHMGEIAKDADSIMAGDVKDQAIRLKEYVQNPQEEAQAIRGILFTQYIGGSIASALINLTQPLTMTMPYLSQFTGIKAIGAKMGDAFKLASTGIKGDDELVKALKRAEEDGTVSPQEIHQLQAQAGGKGSLQSGDGTTYGNTMSVANNALSRFQLGWGKMFSAAEQFNRRVTFIAAFKIAREQKMADPFAFAEHAINTTQGVYNCVDESTECLTKDGWKHHSELVAGEVVYAVDAVTGELVESKLVDVHRHYNPVGIQATEFRNSNGFSMVLTDDHTCLVQNYSSRDKKFQRVMSVKAKDVKVGHHFVRTPQGDATGRNEVYSDDEVRLLAWVASEGHQFSHRNVKEKRGIALVQSNTHNPQYVIEIDDLLNRLGGNFNRKTTGANRADQMVCWQLRKAHWEKINIALPGKMLTHKLVSELTVPQMRIFLETFAKGDGHFPEEGGPTITQKDIGNLSVLQAMAVLSGQSSTLYNRMGGHDFGVLYLAKTSKRAYRKEMDLSPVVLDMVWCPQTEHGTWIARRNGRTFVTGNSGNKPEWARGAIGATLFTFKQYSISYVEFLHRMYGNGPEGKKAVALALAVLIFTAGLGGLPGADDMDDLLDGIMQRLGYNFSSKQKKKEWLTNVFGSPAIAELALRGISGLAGVPIDVAGRMGLGNMVPGTGLLTRKVDHTADYKELAGPMGDFFGRSVEGGSKLLQGDIPGAARSVAPKAVDNWVKSSDMMKTGMYRDTKGNKVVDTATSDAIVKFIGFQPNDVARIQQGTRTVQQMIALAKLVETELADKMAQGRFERNSDKVKAAKEALAEWNRTNPEARIVIKEEQINKRVQSMNRTKAQRLQRTAPREIRAEVRKELEAL